jgi:hypothetical protein
MSLSIGPLLLWSSLVNLLVTIMTKKQVADFSLGDLSILGQGTLKTAIWRGLFQYLLRVYHPRCRQFILRNHHHLIIINQYDSVRFRFLRWFMSQCSHCDVTSPSSQDLALHVVVSLTSDNPRPALTPSNASSASRRDEIQPESVSRLKLFACRRELPAGTTFRSPLSSSSFFGFDD